MNFKIGHVTHTGIKRDHNEDTYGVDDGIWLVADGMGGHDHGELASAIARDSILHHYKAGDSLKQCILKSNQIIIDSSFERGGDLPMGTTVVILTIANSKYDVAWVGDSRVYKFNDEKLTSISTDHSYVQELVDQNLITEEQARTHPHRNVVTQALGVTDNSEIKISLSAGEVSSGDKFLLCSDGLTEEVNDSLIEEIMSKDIHPQEMADQLTIAALKSGGSDNITVIIVCCY
ncbi:Protein serine/threonine phosphatase PrpC, regulation of stationary phase [hydrothermal vent metagenome]|uniref:Protein serine/threonine phosphatase PrpC, regulation of stationary phase n=1 Tax=hydrothermal vent metagenome TaxID=652676 RepID=A0A3B0VBH4_9ZZZZ